MPLESVIDPREPFLDYLLLDVFTDTPFQGNPLAVFPEAGALGTSAMQRIARELNLSETVFIAATPMPGIFDLRIFTPHQELAFAGHPTIGAAWLLREIGWHDDQLPLKLQVPAGEVPIRFDGAHAWLSTPNPLSIEPSPLSRASAAHLLGLSVEAVIADPVVGFACGSPFHLIALTSIEALTDVRVRPSQLSEALGGEHGVNVYMYVEEGDHSVRARKLCITDQVTEDPATGSAAAPLAGHLALQSSETGTLEYTIVQGIEMGRPSRIGVLVDKSGEAVTAIHVGGMAVVIGEGRLRL
ncbi:PhzF family phenazine biosynthesis protein [Kushneria indalinina]|uniref:Trans-2,3-dihydro-3-hydroxyanthranilate isomerase n=1 Tax=Kushneria indalinina DSM 14324 TaxID=1122140 RepID=A0A3D9DXP8_9GAMM|nr:PhzF family phenazine biosynthesis protein [Kushneria indalinina]REC95129.1 trans-2,3-dihydro-3-hydroxyanthranilate isomerase [Kushneria indalinina DSM 14324]